ncbi:MAG TPA: hypothetical protein VMA09_10325 [Candidatus Binataceae bacterium]|nr:hypothetical protein [Candidatus Binataceae bacterium]
MTKRISATEAARNFSDLLNRVAYRHESFVVERGGEPFCEIVPPQPKLAYGRDLIDLIEKAPRPDKRYLDLVEELVRRQPKIAKSPWQR